MDDFINMPNGYRVYPDIIGENGFILQTPQSDENSFNLENEQYIVQLGSVIQRLSREFHSSDFLAMQHSTRAIMELIGYLIPSQSTLLAHQETPNRDQGARYGCPTCRSIYRYSRGTLKRHLQAEHFQFLQYFCPLENAGCSFSTYRKDKIREHWKNAHRDGDQISKDDIQAHARERMTPPQQCSICGNPVNSWNQYLECYLDHITQNESPPAKGPRRREEGDRDGSNGGPSLGHGYNAGTSNYHSHGQGNFMSSGMGAGTDFNGSYYAGGTHYTAGCDLTGCPTPGSKNDISISESAKSPRQQELFSEKTTRKDHTSFLPEASRKGGMTKDSPCLDKIETPAKKCHCGHIMDLCETCQSIVRVGLDKCHLCIGGMHLIIPSTKYSIEENAAQAKAKSMKDNYLQLTQYFETYLYATQKQGSFLSRVSMHETVIISEKTRLLVSSEIMFQTMTLASKQHLDIPPEHLVCLTREKSCKSSDADLEIVRKPSQKRRAHLRVRIRAIAGVLALRAAVSKTPPMANSTDTDGFELSIPRPFINSQDESLQAITWLLHLLILFLRIPNPIIHLVLPDSCSKGTDFDIDPLHDPLHAVLGNI